MKTLLALLVAVSFALGLLAGVQLGGPLALAPVTMPVVELDGSRRPVEGSPLPISNAGSRFEPRNDGRTEVGVLASSGPSRTEVPSEPNVRRSASPGSASMEDDGSSLRLTLDREDALRAWLPFRRFVETQGIDVRALDDDSLRALFERFVGLNELRIAEVGQFALPPALDGVEEPSREADLVFLESVEARYETLEEALAREFHEPR